MDVNTYLKSKNNQLKNTRHAIKDFSVFDFSYIPKQPLMREEAKILIDAVLLYSHTGIPRNLAVFGSRGSGKTLLVLYSARALQREVNIKMLYANVRNHNTSFKILAHLLNVSARGASLDELFNRFCKTYSEKTIVVLDEVDLISPKDRHMEILYLLSRSSNNYMVVLLSNSPRLIQAIDPSARSTLQPEMVHFKNYDAQQIFEILHKRARQGLQKYRKEDLRCIAALTTRNTNSDVRVAIKSLFYSATETDLTIEEAFNRAGKDIVIDVIRDLNDKCLLILESLRRTSGGFVKEVYQRYKRLSETVGEIPFSYVHFYNNLSYLQSSGLILFVSAKVARTYTNRLRLLFDSSILEETFKRRFL
ncbi:Cdc6/Cdc18 family protein [Candidatus Hydrogenedentota bacterium]